MNRERVAAPGELGGGHGVLVAGLDQLAPAHLGAHDPHRDHGRVATSKAGAHSGSASGT